MRSPGTSDPHDVVDQCRGDALAHRIRVYEEVLQLRVVVVYLDRGESDDSTVAGGDTSCRLGAFAPGELQRVRVLEQALAITDVR